MPCCPGRWMRRVALPGPAGRGLEAALARTCTPTSRSRPVYPSETDRRHTERRRAPRLRTRLWVGIPEVEGEPELEECNISVFGMLLHTSRAAGAPGAVRMLRLVNADRDVALEIMGRVVRVVVRDDAKGGRVIEGIGFEFLPHGDEHRRELGDFLRRVAEAEMDLPRIRLRIASPHVPAIDA